MSSSPADQQAARRKTGRPRSTRAPDAIRAAAVRLFSEHGFSGTSVRDIAAAAGVDPALVIRHFGSKEALFLETVSVDHSLRGVVDGPLDTLGRAILRRLVEEVPDDTRKLYRALFGALDRTEVRAYLESSTARHVTAPLAERLPGPDAAIRAELIAAQIAGLLMSGRLFGGGRGPHPDPRVLDIYARAIQALIDSP
ncbi:TetR/AcrR family transcriptional regulator [Nocardia sp. BMG111209]|uniref:TetR/AcrR family transcriptional regulator n=1 Tax=Nocardia sp. BMG111209 TaxID=1160137 RepID=UPI000381C243|nr:TetR/AcrR family transcriptional regulator [Nocardia sp. BMG111209]